MYCFDRQYFMKKIDITSSAQKDQLLTLIKSLTKAEKRNFKLYANRTQSNNTLRFIQLFDVLDKQKEYDEAAVFKKIPKLSKSQLANLKRHLYKQILNSLRLIHIQKQIDIQIREQIDFARILYGKGLYLQSLRLLDRIKLIAIEHNQDLLHLEIVEFQKLIEERHITRSRTIKNKVEGLISEAAQRSKIINNRSQLSNLKIQIHGRYIKMGHVKNEHDAVVVKVFFKSRLGGIQLKGLSFFEKVYLSQSYVWYYYILLDFQSCCKHAIDWVQFFETNPNMIEKDPDLYMRGLHYVLTSLFNLKDDDRFIEYLQVFETFMKKNGKGLSEISQTIAFLYLDTARINKHYLEGSFEEGLELIPGIKKKIRRYKQTLDVHRVMVFYFKMGYLYFANGDPETALDYLNEIISLKAGHLRKDIQSYSRLLHLICHFELGHYELLPYLADSTQRFLEKLGELNKTQRETLRLLRSMINKLPAEHPSAFAEYYKNLQDISRDPFEKRAFLYLDTLTWAESKVQGKSIHAVAKAQFDARKNRTNEEGN